MAKLVPIPITWRSALCESELPPTTRHVAHVVGCYMGDRGESAHPGPTRIAHDTGYHVSTVKAALAELERTGWLVCVQRGGIKGQRKCANVYEARIPEPQLPVVQDYPSSSATGTRRPRHPVPTTTRRPDRVDPSSSPRAPVVQDDPISSEISPVISPRRPRPKNEHFDALVDAFGPASTQVRRSMYAKVAHDLKAAGAEPDEIRRRAGIMQGYDWQNVTPMALAKHWDALGAPHRPRMPEGSDMTARWLEAQEAR